MKTKEFEVTINKSVNGYTVYDDTENHISYFNDDDEGRKALVQYLVNDVMNREVIGGREYK